MVEERFKRTAVLIGDKAIKTLSQKKVVIVGVGGVGSFAVEGLARAGIGELTLIDYDIISITDINRQIHALDSTIGRPKVDVMAERIQGINPTAKINIFKQKFTDKSHHLITDLSPDYLVDAIDSLEDKLSLIEMAVKESIPIISSMGAGRHTSPNSFNISDISKTHTCPLAKKLRKKLREKGISCGVKTVFSSEKPKELVGDIIGSISFVPPVVGLLIAGEVVCDLIENP